MQKEIKINIKDSDGFNGEVVLMRPKAGVRNRAVMEAETADGIKKTVLLVTLLPACIKSHPWGTTPVKAALDSLEISDYDQLVTALSEMMDTGDAEKKSEIQSESNMTKNSDNIVSE